MKDDQDWSVFSTVVLGYLPPGDHSGLGVDELASLITSALMDGGVSAVGYRKSRARTSMKKNSLPKHILVALQVKRQLEVVWKSLSSSNESSLILLLQRRLLLMIRQAMLIPCF